MRLSIYIVDEIKKIKTLYTANNVWQKSQRNVNLCLCKLLYILITYLKRRSLVVGTKVFPKNIYLLLDRQEMKIN